MASPRGSVGARILIIVYGAALVAIGLYPIRREYGSFSRFLKVQTGGLVSDVNLEKLRVKRPMPSGAEQRELKSKREAYARESKEQQLDRLTKDDKTQLESLLGKLD